VASLDRNLRKQLENRVKDARRVAEAGARQAIELLAVQHHEPWGSLSSEQRKLRNRLRAHGRQLGDQLDERKGTQAIDRLVAECAYEHWHRLLFARFLAENDLLVEPQSGVALSLDECRELARERGLDWLVLASDFAQRMLPQIFRAGDPVLDVSLPPEKRQELESILEALPRDVFTADDSLGWVYQFWQAEEKERVNKSGNKIGADELPSVTQLFTEDYMVLFLLHNTLGAWWAGKVLAARPDLARTLTSEAELRRACALAGIDWEYLRFAKNDDGAWQPAAGTLDGWPRAAKDISILDPCMGSGHFLVFALPVLVAFRQQEERLADHDAVEAVLRDNLFGLEIDPRCTQIAAFNLALTAWRRVGFRQLPVLNVACSGISPSGKRDEWLALAGDDQRRREGMGAIHALFERASLLGSLIDPASEDGTLLAAGFRELQPIVTKALAREPDDETARELAVAAAGVAKAAELLSRQYTLVITNVPYLGRGKHHPLLASHCEKAFGDAKSELATCVLSRCIGLVGPGATIATVIKQDWLFLDSYRAFRTRLLRELGWDLVARLGPRAFESIGGEVVNVALMVFTSARPESSHCFRGFDLSDARGVAEKAAGLIADSLSALPQSEQLKNPDARILLSGDRSIPLLRNLADASHGQGSFDSPRFSALFWELPSISGGWEAQQSTPPATMPFGGCHYVFRWENGTGSLAELMQAKSEGGYSSGKWKAGVAEWGKPGILVGQMGEFPCSLYLGRAFDENASVVAPRDPDDLAALWCFFSSDEFRVSLREVDQSIKVTVKTLVKVPFDKKRWSQVAREHFPNGLPEPESSDPTEWLFNGAPRTARESLQVGMARLVGYEWPRQRNLQLAAVASVARDDLREIDEDGIVCLPALKMEHSAADRLRALLGEAFGPAWSSAKLNRLLEEKGFGGKAVEDWLRDGFFEQHCELFHQRPFVWHVWDGLKNGFGAFVNYHRLAAPRGEGRRTLEKLVYTYLGDWIDRQRADQKAGIEGADARVAASEHLKRELEKILDGEPPYDIFVRWKPLHQQPVGWDPDLNDGVRVNIRPFMTAKPLTGRGRNACILRVSPKIKWEKDRGKEPTRPKDDYPWFRGWDEQTHDFRGGSEFDGNRWNDLHYSRAVKLTARERRTTGGKP
jgi:hypothetical protein